MNLSSYSTKDLIAELNRRVEKADKVLAAVYGLTETEPNPAYKVATPKPARRSREHKGVRVLKPEMLVATMKEAKKPLTAGQIHRRLRKGTSSAVLGQLNRLRKKGEVKSQGERPNILWTLA